MLSRAAGRGVECGLSGDDESCGKGKRGGERGRAGDEGRRLLSQPRLPPFVKEAGGGPPAETLAGAGETTGVRPLSMLSGGHSDCLTCRQQRGGE